MVAPRFTGLLLAILASSAAADAESTDARRVRAAASGVAFVKVERLFRGSSMPTAGTAFFIDGKGTLLTNWHVVASRVPVEVLGTKTEISTRLGEIEVVIGSGSATERRLKARVMALDQRRDLALLRVNHTPETWLEIAEQPVDLADEIWVLGYPFGEALSRNARNPEVTVSLGRVTSIRHGEDGREQSIQVDAAVNPGNSGGPMLDRDGRVAGVVNAGIVGANATSFAIPLAVLQEFLRAQQARVSLDPDAIFSATTPVNVRVTPVLADLEGLAGRVTLEADGVQAVSSAMQTEAGEFRAALAVPLRPDGSLAPGPYFLTVTVADQAGAERLQRRFRLEVHAAEGRRIDTGEDPMRRLAERRLTADQAEGGVFPVGTGEPEGGKTPGRRALSDIARDVKLRKDATGTASISNDDLWECRSQLREEDYTLLSDEAARNLAQNWDTAVCEFQAAMSELTRLNGRVVYSSQELGDFNQRIELAAARAGVMRAALKLVQENVIKKQLCRCPDGRWGMGASVPGQECRSPEVPEVH